MFERPQVIYSNDQLLVVNKPAGMASVPERQPNGNSLKEYLLARNAVVLPVHRLDKETSGIIVFAKEAETHRSLSMQFEDRKVKKTYWAIVHGQLTEAMENEAPLAEAGRGLMKQVRKGKPALTRFEPIEVFKSFTLVACYPVTGRTHQIRVHLQGLGFPIVGDVDYGGKQPFLSALKSKYRLHEEATELPIMKRFALHALSLKWEENFPSDAPFTAPLAKDMEAFLKIIRKYNSR